MGAQLLVSEYRRLIGETLATITTRNIFTQILNPVSGKEVDFVHAQIVHLTQLIEVELLLPLYT